ncbi:MAG: hypothetical protein EDM05_018440 [Leptolyngbya sp. IPPAS B-1204]|nr:hypothetical protein [Elainella sp. C42_A2020_010]RNJ68173.1 MAG: hypothetical protein EDM05_17185 [Leptolyngbya sp. IPPAS B-1204]
MVSKGLLLPGVLLALAYGLKTVALPEAKQNTPSQRTSTAAEPRSASQSASGVDDDRANGYSSRLSDLILPLPPMALPELLLPPYNFPSFDSERLDQELQLYLQYLRTHGKPDVLIIGSSRSLQGIDPAALEEALATQGHLGLKVYNFGINGATAQVMNLLMQDILTPEQLPRLVIWGDGSRAFNSGRPDRTYSQIVASPGYQRVQRGERPIPSRTTDWEIPTFVTTANKSLAESVAAANETPVAPDLTLQGFQTVTEQYDPSSYYRRYPRVSGRYDNNYYNFNLRGDQTDATVSLANFARQQGITLVFVNLPLTRDYLADTVRRNYETEFQQHMWRLAARERFMFRDLSQHPELVKNHYFADPSHINRHGARAVAFQLAADRTIPWHIVGSAPASRSSANPSP